MQKRGDVGLVHVFSALDGADLVGEAGAAAFVDFPALECQNALRERGRVAGIGLIVLDVAHLLREARGIARINFAVLDRRDDRGEGRRSSAVRKLSLLLLHSRWLFVHQLWRTKPPTS